MGWSIGYDDTWKRDIGYGVPATCDHPGCAEAIDRGLGHVCGGEPFGGDEGCGLYFCSDHLFTCIVECVPLPPDLCERCMDSGKPFEPSPDVAEWITHKLTDPSWQRWRDDNPAEVETLQVAQAGAQMGADHGV